MPHSRFDGHYSDPLADPRHSRSRADLEFALRLEYAKPGDPGLLEALIDRYAGKAVPVRARFAVRLRQPEAGENRNPDPGGQGVFKRDPQSGGLSRPDQRERLAVRAGCGPDPRPALAAPRAEYLRRLAHQKSVMERRRREPPAEGTNAVLLAAADRLPEMARLIFILRFQCGLEVEEIAQVLDRLPGEIEARLETVRERLLEAGSLEQEGFERVVRGAVHARLSDDDFRLVDASGFKAQALAGLRPRRRLPQIELPLAKFGWFALVLVIAGLSAWLGVQLNQQVDADVQAPSRYGPPDPIEVSDPVVKGLVSGDPGTPAAMPNLFNSEPSLSADGRYLAFTSTFADLAVGEDQVNVYVYDRVQGAVELISAAEDGQPAKGYSQSPSISADGRWLVFTSTAADLAPEGASPCAASWNDIFGDCWHVYLRDRQYGYTQSAERRDWRCIPEHLGRRRGSRLLEPGRKTGAGPGGDLRSGAEAGRLRQFVHLRSGDRNDRAVPHWA